MKIERHFPWILLALCSAWIAASALPSKSKTGFNLEAFGRLPVLHNGRLKPIDTVADSALLMLRGRRTVKLDGKNLTSMEWMAEVLARPEKADAAEIFYIQDPDVLGLMGRREEKKKHFSYKELEPHLGVIETQASSADPVESQLRSRFQSAIVNLRDRVLLYQRLKNTLQPEETADFPSRIAAYQKSIPAGLKALRDHQSSPSFDRKALASLNVFFEQFHFLSRAAVFYPLPPRQGEDPHEWKSLGDGLLEAMGPEGIHPHAHSFAFMLKSYGERDSSSFNSAIGKYERVLDLQTPKTAFFAHCERIFNRIRPFYKGMVLYLLAFLLTSCSWLFWPRTLARSAYFLLLLTFGIHTAGILARMILEGRPPVTNLYSSALFVGWTAVLLGIILERMNRQGLGSIVASGVGFCTLLIAHNLTGSGDTMEMMRAVLDSNFWLGTHVVTITIGYSGTFLAGALAHVYILRGFFTRSLDKETAQSLTKMTYGVICFSLFFSFVGTILGGIWADQSWGRFWGWDPKENGALLIVLWNAIILHARWGGFIRERGLMVLAVFGNIVTSLSWFGVNMLGIGLHSYGFIDKAFFALSFFVLSQLIVMALGALPSSRWRGLPQA